MAVPGMVGMAVGEHGPLHRPYRIDMKAARLAAEAGGDGHQDVLRTHLRYIVPRELHSSLVVSPCRLTTSKPVIGSDARASIPVIRRSDRRPPVRFRARPAAERRPCRRRRSVVAGHRARARL